MIYSITSATLTVEQNGLPLFENFRPTVSNQLLYKTLVNGEYNGNLLNQKYHITSSNLPEFLFKLIFFNKINQEVEIRKNLLFLLVINITTIVLLFFYLLKINHFVSSVIDRKSNLLFLVKTLSVKYESNLQYILLNERDRIKDDVHDIILGSLMGIRLGLGLLPIKGSSKILWEHKNYLTELKNVENNLRDIINNLHMNDKTSLEYFNALILNELTKLEKIFNINFELKYSDTFQWKQVSSETKSTIYRILKESISNIVKHSKADKVIVNFHFESESIVMKIEDNGKGFNTDKIERGIGLNSINSRIYKLNGFFKISSAIKDGTSLTIKIPI